MQEVNSSNRWTLITKIRVTTRTEVEEEEEAAEVAKWEETEEVIWADSNNSNNIIVIQTINNKWCLVSNSNSSWQDHKVPTCNSHPSKASLHSNNHRWFLQTNSTSRSSFLNLTLSSMLSLKTRRLSLVMQFTTKLPKSWERTMLVRSLVWSLMRR